MNKLLIVIFAFFLTSIGLLGQPLPEIPSEDWSKFTKKPMHSNFYQVVGKDETGYYFLRTGRILEPCEHTSLRLEKYSKDGMFVASRRIKFKEGGKHRFFEFMVNRDDSLFIYSSVFDDKEKKLLLFKEAVLPQTLEFIGLKKVAEVDCGSSPVRDGRSFFKYALSPDKSKLLIAYRWYDKERRVPLFVFNAKDELEWEVEAKIKISPRAYVPIELGVTNDGDALVWTNFDVRMMHDETDGFQSSDFTLSVFRNKGKDFWTNYVYSNTGLVTGMKAKFLANGNVACAGFLQSKKEGRKAFSFWNEFDPNDGKLLKRTEQPLGTIDMAIKPEYFFHDADGDYWLLGSEQSGGTFSFENTSRDILTGDIEKYHAVGYSRYYQGIYVTKFSGAGELEWEKKIDMDHKFTSNFGNASFYATLFNGDLIVIFNDDPKTLKFSKQYDYGGAVRVVNRYSKITSTGDIENFVFQEKSALPLAPKAILQTAEGLVIPAENVQWKTLGFVPFH